MISSTTRLWRTTLQALAVVAWIAYGVPGVGAADPPESPTPLPAGTVLWLRLDTAVSTTTSRLHQQVTAHVAREVREADTVVVVPLGTPVTGEITKLFPSSSPTDRARLQIQFTRLNLPNQSQLTLTGHVKDVDNSRETVLADGTIRGLLASEVPASNLDALFAKINKSDPTLGGQIQDAAARNLGKVDTSVSLPVGTTLEFVLDQALAVTRTFTPTIAITGAPTLEAVANLLAHAPQRTQTKEGTPGDPLNLVVIGSASRIQQAFEKAGWLAAQEKTGKSIWKTIGAMASDSGYGEAPVSQLYLFGRPEDMAWERMFNTFTKRHHLRLWQTTATTPDGQPIWLGAATHDIGIDIHPGVISHATDPDLDDERSGVAADLESGGAVRGEKLVSRSDPLTSGVTGTGGAWHTDGRLVVLELK